MLAKATAPITENITLAIHQPISEQDLSHILTVMFILYKAQGPFFNPSLEKVNILVIEKTCYWESGSGAREEAARVELISHR